ncbi:MAG TPA: hypothetical protein VK760_02365 [Candidatus Acidoferrales bacterium]|nr:hypothetical protein [Candidatus Acidoferrales bacterium]
MSRISFAFVGLLAATLLLASPAGARPKPTPSPSPTAAPVADPAITKLARQQFLAWQIGTIDKNLYSADLLAKATDDKIADVSKHIAPLGALISLDYIAPFSGEDFPPGAKGYIYQMNCSNGKIFEEIVLTDAGKIGYLYFRDTLTTEDVTTQGASPPTPPTPLALPPV